MELLGNIRRWWMMIKLKRTDDKEVPVTPLEKRLFHERNDLLLAIEIIQWDSMIDRLYEDHKCNALISIVRLKAAIHRAHMIASDVRRVMQEREFE